MGAPCKSSFILDADFILWKYYWSLYVNLSWCWEPGKHERSSTSKQPWDLPQSQYVRSWVPATSPTPTPSTTLTQYMYLVGMVSSFNIQNSPVSKHQSCHYGVPEHFGIRHIWAKCCMLANQPAQVSLFLVTSRSCRGHSFGLRL